MLLPLLLVAQAVTSYGTPTAAAPSPLPYLRFAPPVFVPTGGAFMPTGIAAGDLDGDGLVDILTANSFADSISVLRNLGGGTFSTVLLTAGGAEIRDVALGDVTGDGILDAVVSLRSGLGAMAVFDGIGDGSLAAPRILGPGRFASDLELADLDGDGDLDAALSTMGGPGPGDPNATVLFNDGKGSFSGAQDYTFVSNVPFTYGTTMAIGDVDGDGDVDLVGSGQPNVTVVTLLRGLGDGTFTSPEQVLSGLSAPMALELHDVDGDGDADVAAYDGRFPDSRVVLGENDGTGSFSPWQEVATGGAAGFEEARRALAFADFNGDGVQDLVASDAFAVGTPFGLRWVLPAPRGFEAAVVDFDGDGRLDVLTATWDESFTAMVAISFNQTP